MTHVCLGDLLISDSTLGAYNERRQADAEAICDLALYNYIEVRQHSSWASLSEMNGQTPLLHALSPY